MCIYLIAFKATDCLKSDVRFPMLGDHNVQNCLAAIGVALEMNIDRCRLQKHLPLLTESGADFETKGRSNGVTIIDDHGHHPVEISTLKAGRMLCGNNKLSRYSTPSLQPLADLFTDFCSCFNEADEVLVADVYAAGGRCQGADKTALVAGLRDYV